MYTPFYVFKKENKLTQTDLRLIVEAYRRYYLMDKEQKPLDQAWIGLGMPSDYKSKYFRAYGKVRPRELNWYMLSDEGIKLFKKFVEAFPVPENSKEISTLNTKLFEMKL